VDVEMKNAILESRNTEKDSDLQFNISSDSFNLIVKPNTNDINGILLGINYTISKGDSIPITNFLGFPKNIDLSVIAINSITEIPNDDYISKDDFLSLFSYFFCKLKNKPVILYRDDFLCFKIQPEKNTTDNFISFRGAQCYTIFWEMETWHNPNSDPGNDDGDEYYLYTEYWTEVRCIGGSTGGQILNNGSGGFGGGSGGGGGGSGSGGGGGTIDPYRYFSLQERQRRIDALNKIKDKINPNEIKAYLNKTCLVDMFNAEKTPNFNNQTIRNEIANKIPDPIEKEIFLHNYDLLTNDQVSYIISITICSANTKVNLRDLFIVDRVLNPIVDRYWYDKITKTPTWYSKLLEPEKVFLDSNKWAANYVGEFLNRYPDFPVSRPDTSRPRLSLIGEVIKFAGSQKLNTQFEIKMFENYWLGLGDYTLTQSEFDLVVSEVNRIGVKGSPTFIGVSIDGRNMYKTSVELYDSDPFNFSLGVVDMISDGQNYIGLIDNFDFDAHCGVGSNPVQRFITNLFGITDRGMLAEWATRMTAGASWVGWTSLPSQNQFYAPKNFKIKYP